MKSFSFPPATGALVYLSCMSKPAAPSCWCAALWEFFLAVSSFGMRRIVLREAPKRPTRKSRGEPVPVGGPVAPGPESDPVRAATFCSAGLLRQPVTTVSRVSKDEMGLIVH